MGTGGFDIIAVLLLLRLGQILLLCGAVRSKNAAEAAVRGLLDLAVAVLALWAVGAAFDPADSRLAGHPVFAPANLFGAGGMIGFRAFAPAVLVATAAVFGATAERTRLSPVLTMTVLFAAMLVPLGGLCVMTGWAVPAMPHVAIGIAAIGGGVAGLVLAHRAGPRQGKFNRDLSANLVPGHSLVLQPAGLLLIGVAFVLMTGLPALLGLSAALLTTALYGRLRFEKIDFGLLLGGGLAGLIAATAVGMVPTVGREILGGGGATAVIAGALAGLLTPVLMLRLETRWRIDDVAGFAAASITGGLVGPGVALLLQWPAKWGAYAKVALQLSGLWVLFAGIACGGMAWLVARVFAGRGRLRVTQATEYDGLDLSELDLNAYPDFQQTMIKSHHLRQL